MKLVSTILPIAGALMIVFGIVILLAFPTYIAKKIENENYLGHEPNGSLNAMTKSWLTPTYDMKLSIWVYSVTNAKAVVNGAKPHVIEKGPYTFIEKQSKNYTFLIGDERILYFNNHTYHFSQNDSCLTCFLNDKVTVPNILLQKLIDAHDDASFLVKFTIEEAIKLANETVFLTVNKLIDAHDDASFLLKFAIEEATKLANETLFLTVNVGDLLFNGYNDPLVSSICKYPGVSTICKSLGIPEKVGLFYGQNNTDDGSYLINTGLKSAKDLGKLYAWKNMTVLPGKYWYGPQARMINGTDGQLFSPFLLPNQKLTIFVGQICRSIDMEVTGAQVFLVTEAMRRSQLNVGVLPGKIPELSKLKPAIIPIIWLNETAIFDEETRGLLTQVSFFTKISTFVGIIVLSLGSFLILLTIGTFLVKKYYRKVDEPLITDDDEEDDEIQVPLPNASLIVIQETPPVQPIVVEPVTYQAI
uniref:Uncharacterized protein n=1 Tax=Panagrolaimus sp. PS1159 TaxID=55785 RepID=A0AC35FZA0_9BILA